MIKIIPLIAFVLFLSPLNALAQEDADAVLEVLDVQQEEVTDKKEIKAIPDGSENYEERLVLAERMHEIWPIRPKIESALDIVSGQIEPTRRLEFKAGMRKAIAFDALEQASIEAMTDIYSMEELQAMINFYGSKAGRSASHKTLDYEQALRPLMTQMIDKALLDNKLGN